MKKIILFIAVILVGLTMSITSKGNDNNQISDKSYYQNLDKMLVNVVRTSLEKEGYLSCGITLSSVTELNNVKEYTIKIHHHKITELNDNNKNLLMAKLENISYPYDDCKVNYVFVE